MKINRKNVHITIELFLFLKKLCTATTTTTTTNALQKKKEISISRRGQQRSPKSIAICMYIYIYDVYTHILWVSYHLILFFLSTVEVNEYKLQSKSLDGRAQQAFQALCLCFPYTTRVSLSLSYRNIDAITPNRIYPHPPSLLFLIICFLLDAGRRLKAIGQSSTRVFGFFFEASFRRSNNQIKKRGTTSRGQNTRRR